MKRLLIVCAAFVATAALAQDEQVLIETTKQAVAGAMKDPSSVQFQNLTVLNGGKTRAVCGEYNAKNSYGGYVGFKRFYKYEDSANIVVKKGDPILDRLVDAVCKPS